MGGIIVSYRRGIMRFYDSISITINYDKIILPEIKLLRI